MRKFAAALLLLLMLGPCVAQAADLTPTETRWLKGMWPVVVFAKEAKLPLDIVVQPQATRGVAPLAMAFVEGRCKLVLSMRGNPEAEATLARLEPALLDNALELMAAHELGHCRRHVDGAWHGLPAGFTADRPDGLNPALAVAHADIQAERREEGYGDLVGLAWTRQRHPQQYARLHAWLLDERAKDLVDGSQHDTLAWVRLARDGAALAATASIFDSAAALWLRALDGAD